MPYSNFTKIFDLLTELEKEGSPTDLFQFAEEIQKKEIESFAIWRPGPDPEAPPAKSYCSPTSIRRLIRFTAELGLIGLDDERQCTLTTYGQNALRGDNYVRVLSTHLTMYLKEKSGVTYSEIKDIIASVRRPQVAFFETIYGLITEEQELHIGKARFRMVLYLLERCSMLTSITRKIYFAPEMQAWGG